MFMTVLSGPMKYRFLTVSAIYAEPMTHNGFTRIMIYLGLALSTYDTAPGFRSGRQNFSRDMKAPNYLDRSL